MTILPQKNFLRPYGPVSIHNNPVRENCMLDTYGMLIGEYAVVPRNSRKNNFKAAQAHPDRA